MIQLLGQMMWLPASMLAWGMSLAATALRGMQPAGVGVCRSCGASLDNGIGAASGGAAPAFWTDRNHPGTYDGRAQNESKEDRKMSDRHCCCDDQTVKLVEYTIVSIKPCDERIIHKGEEIYSDGMSPEAFAAWVIAQYLQDPKNKSIPHDEKRYLRVSQRELAEWPRPDDCCEDRQLDVLKGIEKAIRNLGYLGGERQEAAAS